MANTLISIINLMGIVFVISLSCALVRAKGEGVSSTALLSVVALATAFGLMNAWFPPVAALRDQFAFAQPVMVISLVSILLFAGFGARGRSYFQTAQLQPLIALHGWRLLFGTLLLITGLIGGLPPEFFWSVALGDIGVGLWAISIWQREKPASQTELKLWSAVGLADLLHLLPRAIITLPPFYEAHPDLFRPILLPLLGVPILIALHLLLLRRFLADDKAPESHKMNPIHEKKCP